MNATANPPVLITGAAGFIGSHLVDYLLANGVTVVGLDNFIDFYDPAVKRRNLQAAQRHGGFSLVEADIRDRDAVREAFDRYRPGIVVHLAAMAGVRPSIEQSALYTDVNLCGTTNVLDGAVAHGAEKFIFASSSSIYGNNEKIPFAEDDRVDHPISPYAATKRAGELICHTYWHIHHLPVFCLRLFTVYGPRQRPDLAFHKFLRCTVDQKPIDMFGDGTTSRDYTYIDDIVSGIKAAMEKCDRFRVYNLGGDDPVSLGQMIATIEQATGRKLQIRRQPMQPGDMHCTWADLTRSRAELGYRPTTRLAEGIAEQWRSLQEERG